MVYNVGYYSDNQEIKSGLAKLASIRNITLERCYKIDGYEELPRKEKNIIYDRIREEVSREIGIAL